MNSAEDIKEQARLEQVDSSAELASEQSEQHEQNGLQNCQADLVKVQEQFAYARADFENYRRNIERDKAQWKQQAQLSIILDIIALIDTFERVNQEIKQNLKSEGFDLLYKSFLKLLHTYGVEEIKVGEDFDPVYHEAVMQIDAEDKPSGTIVAVFEKGYTLKGVVIRPAKVSVAK